MEQIILLVEKITASTGHGESEEILLLASRIGPNRTKEYYPAFASEELANEFMNEMCTHPHRLQAIPLHRFKPGNEPKKDLVSIEISLPSWYSPEEWVNMIYRHDFHFELIRTDLEKTEHVFRAATDDNYNFFELGMAVSRILE